ncbi:kinase-like domain-containing protein [Trichoderma longibrachiatum]
MDPDEDEVLYSAYGRKVINVADTIVKKKGNNLRACEPETLKFIAENTTIPVPRVQDTVWQDGQLKCIVMDFVPGKRLDKIWGDLTSEQKLSVAHELHGFVHQLRCLRGDYIGAVNGGKALFGRRSPIECGPFGSEREWNAFILEDIISSTPRMMRHLARYCLSRKHQIVFTHGDLAPRNILVDEKTFKVTAVLDWEEAGWYPEHWEYIKAYQHLQPMADWPDYLAHVLPLKYEKEYIGMSFLYPLLYH